MHTTVYISFLSLDVYVILCNGCIVIHYMTIIFSRDSLIFLIFIYLFLAVSGLSCGMQDLSLQRAGSSLPRAGFSLVVVRRLQSVWAH